MKPNPKGARLVILLSLIASSSLNAALPVVSNVRGSQRAGTQLVDVYYDLADQDSSALTVTVAVSTNGGDSYTLPATSFTGVVGTDMTRGMSKRITWNPEAVWPERFFATLRFRL